MKALTQAFKSIRRSPYQAAAAVLILTLTFFVGYALTLFLMGSNVVLHYFESRPQVMGFFKQDTTEQVLEGYANTLRALPYVKHVTVVNQEEALEIFRRQTANEPLIQDYVTADILPPSLEISTQTLDDMSRVADELGKLEGIDEVVYQKAVVEKLRDWSITLRKVGFVVLGVFGVTSMLVILVITSIRIASKKGEIKIMRLMGATGWYITLPFLLEGMVYGILGSVVAWAVTYLTLLYATPSLQAFFSDVPLVPVAPTVMLMMLAGGTAVGLLVGAAASLMSAKRLLRW